MKKIIIAILVFVAAWPVNGVLGKEETSFGPEDYDFSEIDGFMENNDSDFSFSDTVNEFYKGNSDAGFENIGKVIIEGLSGELVAQKSVIFKIIAIGIIAALMTNVTSVFLTGEISETGFYVVFMLLLNALITGYVSMAYMINKAMGLLIDGMNVIVPVYVLSLGFASGASSATAFYGLISLIIAIIENLIKGFILPLINVFLLVGMINNLSGGNFLSRAYELIKTIIEWMLKALLSVVIGMNVVRGMINPVVDGLKTSSFGKAVSMIPGIGTTLSGVSQIVLGTGILIKNSIGMAAMTAIIVLCFMPVIKSVAISIGYKLAGAALEPVSDKRVVNVINCVYEAAVLLTKTLLYSIVFFLLTIAIICNSTNQNPG